MSSVALGMTRVVTVEAIEHPVLNALIVINGIMLKINVLSYIAIVLMPTLLTLMRLTLNSLVALHNDICHSY